MFIAGVCPGGEAIIIVLDGAVYANNVPLEAGYNRHLLLLQRQHPLQNLI